MVCYAVPNDGRSIRTHSDTCQQMECGCTTVSAANSWWRAMPTAQRVAAHIDLFVTNAKGDLSVSGGVTAYVTRRLDSIA